MSEENIDDTEAILDSHYTNMAACFVDLFVEGYVHRDRSGYISHYKHENHAEAFRADWIGNYYVTFSIPKNKTSVVCSFWVMEENESGEPYKRKIQIDLVPTMKHLIEYYYNKNYLPMPKRDSDGDGDF